MKRRDFILGAGTLALTSAVTGCDANNSATLRVRLLQNSIPVQLLNEFKQRLKQSVKLDFSLETQLNDSYTNLRTWKNQGSKTKGGGWEQWVPFTPKVPVIADLVTLGDYWLASAIQQGLIQPLDPAQLKQWSQLPRRWQELVKRNDQGQLDPKGKVWGAPYRWGCTVIAYRRDKFKSGGEPKDWSDLWRQDLQQRISLLDHPREVIGLTLKKLGSSYNTPNLDKVSGLKDALQKLKGQVKLYSSDTYLQPLTLGDTWLAVGWSTDVLLAQKQEPEIAVVIPKSGTALWSDVWVRPAGAASDIKLIREWIDFCWQPNTANQISLFSGATSPVSVGLKPADIPNGLQKDRLLLPEPQVLDKSEFLYPLPQSTIEQYLSLWQTIRT